VFWDNQQQNDFRAAVVLPIPLHQRPAGFAHALRGYTLNSPVPLSAHASTCVTAGAWAWNPDAYDAGAAWGAALRRLYGPAAEKVADALTAWGALLGELMAPRMGTEQHYRGLRTAVRDGGGDAIGGRLDTVESLLNDAAGALPGAATELALDGLRELAKEVGRLRLDLALAACDDRAEADRLVAAITDILACRLPPEPELRALAAGAEMPGAPVPGISWYLHFVAGPLRAGPRRLQQRIDGR
jgi:hypothetical protein